MGDEEKVETEELDEEVVSDPEEVSEDEEIDVEEVEEEGGEEADEDFDIDDELTFDEDGNIVIPEEDEEDDDAEDEETQGDDGADGNAASDPVEVAEPAERENEELLRVKREFAAFRAQVKDTLEKLGENGDDLTAGLIKIAAESVDKSPEDYMKEREEAARTEAARLLLQRTEFERMAAADLRDIHAAYPETRQYDSIRKIPNVKRFGQLRDLGLSAKEAYIAANPDAVRESVAAAAKSEVHSSGKEHQRSAVPKGSRGNTVTMTRRELAEWKEMFPNLTNKEIAKLYRDTAK